jgi:CHAT domain-containing protein
VSCRFGCKLPAEPLSSKAEFPLQNLHSHHEHQFLPRVWWCPTGALVDLPIHAAGIYDHLHSVCVCDYVISSYAPMLSTLLSSGDDNLFILNSPRTLAVGQAQAKGASALPGTIKELEHIRQICGQRVTSLEGDQANITRVVAKLRAAELVHLASHGQQIDPGFDSGLILHNGRLKISELVRQRVPHGRLAFLSACETAKGKNFSADEYAEADHSVECRRPWDTR